LTLGGFVTPFVVPPLNLAFVALLATVAGWRRLAGVALVGLLLLAVPAVPDALLAALERGQGGGDPAAAQAIVVLGAEVVRQPDGRTAPGLLTLGRLRAAASLARRTGLPILVAGGITQSGAAPVAVAMADSLRDDFATPARWVEDRSADTFENAADSAAMLAGTGVTAVLVVTDQWHMRRALIAFRAAGLRAIPAPVPPQAPGSVQVGDFIPRVGAWMSSYYALHEWMGIAWYSLRALR
jgi:uncharacterized SAM-binding protein YcdF (DUF218 family)